jgi:hypothetical protein
MAAALWTRVTGRNGGGSNLLADLKRATDSKLMEIPEEILAPIAEASSTEEGRQELMRHLQQCLAEPSGAKWLRVHAGLAIVEDLLKRGSMALFAETAEGHHFDLVQRLSFLEFFEHTADRRAQHVIRTKAKPLRGQVMERLQEAAVAVEALPRKDNESTGSPGAVSIASVSTAASKSGYSAFDFNPKVKGPPVVISGMVSVGHNDDTTSESSGGEAGSAHTKNRKQTRKSARERNQKKSGDSSDSDGGAPAGRSSPAAVPAVPVAAAPMRDLLDL